jgi:hypothetical protein
MTWKNAFHRAVKKEMQPMHQVTYWILFLACGAMYVIGVISGAASASYALIQQNPEIASTSWLVTGLF